MSETKLLPCPFCGAPADGQYVEAYNVVFCSECELMCWHEPMFTPEAWNTRSPASTQDLQEARELIAYLVNGGDVMRGVKYLYRVASEAEQALAKHQHKGE